MRNAFELKFKRGQSKLSSNNNDIGSRMDITILDPKTMKENATYAKGTLQPPECFMYW